LILEKPSLIRDKEKLTLKVEESEVFKRWKLSETEGLCRQQFTRKAKCDEDTIA
jgi:hypothetical protein